MAVGVSGVIIDVTWLDVGREWDDLSDDWAWCVVGGYFEAGDCCGCDCGEWSVGLTWIVLEVLEWKSDVVMCNLVDLGLILGVCYLPSRLGWCGGVWGRCIPCADGKGCRECDMCECSLMNVFVVVGDTFECCLDWVVNLSGYDCVVDNVVFGSDCYHKVIGDLRDLYIFYGKSVVMWFGQGGFGGVREEKFGDRDIGVC
ncbi:hypothetical protein Tco_0487602 [Tanacetum coccineum]